MADRHITYRLRAFLQGGKVSVADEVEFDNTGRTGVGSGVTDIQSVLNRIDILGLGTPVFSFTGSYVAQGSNIDEWFQREITGADGQTNAQRTFSLPGTTAVQTALTRLTTAGLPSVLSMRISYFGGPSTQMTVNSLTISPRAGGPNIAGRTNVMLSRGQQVAFEITSSTGLWSVTSMGAATNGGGAGEILDDIELRRETWNATANAALPTVVLRGYAFRVTGAPADGSGRFGVRMADGDLVIFTGDSFTDWAVVADWFVLSEADGKHISSTESNFLLTVVETDTETDFRKVHEVATRALVWLSPALFAAGDPPHISPNGDPINPRAGQTRAYEGGEDDVNAAGDFELSINYTRAALYVGITPSYITNNGADDVEVVIRNIDGSEHARYDLVDDFESVLGNSAFNHYLLNPSGVADSFQEVNYYAGQTIEIWERQTQTVFTLGDAVDITANVDDLTENQLSLELQAKINGESALSFLDQEKLDNITTTTSTDTNAIDVLIKSGSASVDITDYHTLNTADGLPPSFTSAVTWIVAVPDNTEITGASGIETGTATIAEITPSLLSGRRMFRVTIPVGGTGLNFYPINVSNTTVSEFDFSDLYKIDANNLDEPLTSAIFHSQTELPEPLRALANGADIFNITHTDYRINNPHAYISSAFAALKNAPTTFPNTAGVFANEIVGSSVTVDDPSPVTAIQEVSSLTNNAMTGAGISSNGFGINMFDENNWRLIIGGWLYYSELPELTNILSVRERNGGAQRMVIGVNRNNIVFRQRTVIGSSVNFTVTHHLYSTEGLIQPSIVSGTLTQSFRVYTAGTYAVRLTGRLAGALQGGQALNYTVTNVNTDQAPTTLSYSIGVTQSVKVEFKSSSTLFGGAAHSIQVSVDSIASGLDEIEVEVLSASSTVPTSSGNTYSNMRIDDRHARANRLMRFIVSFRSLAGLETDNLEAILVLAGYDDNGNPQIFDENTFNFGYPALDLRWDDFVVGGANGVVQNVQGFFLNPDTPLSEYPRHSTIRDWMTNHDAKSSDWVWGNVHGPSQDTEAVHFTENVNFENQILVSPSGTKYRLSVSDSGALTTSVVT